MKNITAKLTILCIIVLFSGCGAVAGKGLSKTEQLLADEKLIESMPFQDGAWIQRKIDTFEGQELVIPSGRYMLPRTLLIKGRENRPLVIMGENNTILHVKDVYTPVMSIVASSHITVENLKMSHVKPSKEYECHGAVVEIRNSYYIAVVNCVLNGSGAIGFSAWTSNNLKLKRCSLFNNTFSAVYLSKCKDVQIIDNLIFKNGSTYQAHTCGSVEIWGNEIQDNGGYWYERTWKR